MSRGNYRFLFAAGGTGGHLYPAVAVAEQLELIYPDSKILFVGTKKKMEARIIPQLGYAFKTIWISGFSRKFNLSNLLFPIKLIVSFVQSILLSLKFKPTVAIGAGAYVSGPILRAASLFGSKIVLLEQNSYPGITNRILEKKADSIHISFDNSRRYFKNESKLRLTGNPIRLTLKLSDRSDAVKGFSLIPDKKVLLVLGGSLGARSINDAVEENLSLLMKNEIQIIWQTGDVYYKQLCNHQNDSVKIFSFISNMSLAYSACDLLVARSGATTIAEVAYLGLPVIFVPSTNVSANHQYKNALSIVEKKGGLLVEDEEICKELGSLVVDTIYDEIKLKELKDNIKLFSKPNAAKEIALDVMDLAESV